MPNLCAFLEVLNIDNWNGVIDIASCISIFQIKIQVLFKLTKYAACGFWP